MTNKNTTACLVAAALALSACGSGGGDPIVAVGAGSAEDPSAVTAAGADSGIEPDGDDRPETEEDGASVVSVVVEVPDGAELAGTAIVSLEDITYSDVDSVEIASIELPVAQLREQGDEVEVFLPLPLDGSIDVTATVHIDVDENGTLSQGDWFSPELAPVTRSASTVTVGIVRI